MDRIVDYFTSTWKLWRFKAAINNISKAYEVDRLAVKKEKKSSEAIRELDEREHFESSLYYDQISQIKSQRLCRTAARYDVHISMQEDWWETSPVIGSRYLTTKGYSELRSTIRKEKNERWARWEVIIRLFIVPLTGIIGALIGLVTVLEK